jgi:hypothetical protein
MTDLFPDSLPLPAGPAPDDDLVVARAMALLWSYRPRTTLLNALRLLGYKRGDGRAFNAENIKEQQRLLRQKGLLQEHPQRQGYYRLSPALRGELYRQLLAEGDRQALEAVLLQLAGGHGYGHDQYYWALYDREAAVALVRLNVLGGASAESLHKLKARIAQAMDWRGILKEAVLEDFDPETFVRIVPEWRWNITLETLAIVTVEWDASLLPIVEWALAQADRQPDAGVKHVSLGLAELLLNRGERERALAILEGVESGAAGALRAFALAQQGRWSEAAVLAGATDAQASGAGAQVLSGRSRHALARHSSRLGLMGARHRLAAGRDGAGQQRLRSLRERSGRPG